MSRYKNRAQRPRCKSNRKFAKCREKNRAKLKISPYLVLSLIDNLRQLFKIEVSHSIDSCTALHHTDEQAVCFIYNHVIEYLIVYLVLLRWIYRVGNVIYLQTIAAIAYIQNIIRFTQTIWRRHW